MEFVDLKKQYERLKPQIQHRINTVLEHGKFIMGPEVVELEHRLAALRLLCQWNGCSTAQPDGTSREAG